MKKSAKNTFIKWLKGEEDLLLNTKNDEKPVYDPSATDKHIYEKEAKKLVGVEAAEKRSFNKLYIVLSIILVFILASTLLITVSNLPRYGSPGAPVNNEVSERYIESGLEETGAVNLRNDIRLSCV